MNKAALLDSVQDEMGPLTPDLDYMKTMVSDDIVLPAFCETCGTYHGLRYKEAESILLSLKQPIEFEHKYFIFTSCPNCKHEKKEVSLQAF